MTVRAIAQSIYEFTTDGDVLLELLKIESLGAYTTTDSGEVIVYTHIYDPSKNPGAPIFDAVYSAANRRELWRSGAMNAGAVVESAINIGNAYGIEVSMPAGARLVIYTQNT